MLSFSFDHHFHPQVSGEYAMLKAAAMNGRVTLDLTGAYAHPIGDTGRTENKAFSRNQQDR